MFGSDDVFVPEQVAEASVRRLNAYRGSDDGELAEFEQGNARRLFTRFAAK